MGNSILAIILGIVSYSMLNIGLVLEKKGADELPKIEGQSFFSNMKNFLTNKTWVTGLLLTSVQFGIFAIALDLGSLSLVTPLLGVGLIVLMIFSHFYLKEKITKDVIIAMVLIVISVIIIGVTNSDEEIIYSLEEINVLFANINSIIFFIIIILIIVIPVLISIKNSLYKADMVFGFASGISAGLATIFTKATMAGIDTNDFIGSITISMGQWSWWLFIIIFSVGNTISMSMQNVGFQNGKSTTVNTLYTAMGLIIPIFGGIILFSEWSSLTPMLIIIKCIAIIVILIGVVILLGSRNIEVAVTSSIEKDTVEKIE